MYIYIHISVSYFPWFNPTSSLTRSSPESFVCVAFRWLGWTSASRWRTKPMRCGSWTGVHIDQFARFHCHLFGHISDNERLGAMGLAERKEVNLDFSKEDDEKRPAAQVLHWRKIYIYIQLQPSGKCWTNIEQTVSQNQTSQSSETPWSPHHGYHSVNWASGNLRSCCGGAVLSWS